MVTLKLTLPEALALKQAVDAKLAVLMNELVHSDSREYREYLKQSVGILEQLQARLANPAAADHANV